MHVRSYFEKWVPTNHLTETMDLITATQSAETEADLLREALKFAGRFGATYILAGSMPLDGETKRQQVDHLLLSAWPTDWAARYFAQNYVFHDPTIKMVRECHAPFQWRNIASSRLSAGAASEIMGEAKEFGLGDGFTVSVPTMDGATIGFSIAGERLEMGGDEEDQLKLLAIFTVERALQLKKLDARPLSQGVTYRERRALQFAADGLDHHEISVRMGIADCTAEGYLRSVRRKLGAKNTTNAIAIAIRAGLMR